VIDLASQNASNHGSRSPSVAISPHFTMICDSSVAVQETLMCGCAAAPLRVVSRSSRDRFNKRNLPGPPGVARMMSLAWMPLSGVRLSQAGSNFSQWKARHTECC
jgi:hypothetical protein